MSEHLCKHCKKLMVARPGESRTKLAARIYCSRACNIHAQKKVPPPRDCPVCSKPMSPRPSESHAEYMRRQTCSTGCRNALKWAKLHNRPPKPPSAAEPCHEAKHCMNCNKLLVGKRPNEGWAEYRKRRFCSQKCSQIHRTREYRQRWNGAAIGNGTNIRETIPAATEEEWLRRNSGPTMCPPRYAAPVEHYMHIPTRSGRAR